MRHLSWLAVGLLAIAVFAVSQTVNDADAQAADLGTETLELQPGDNFVGWLAEPKPVAEVFAELPEASLIYTWDALTRTYLFAARSGIGNLETLESGMAAQIRVEGNNTVEWERPLTPAKGMVTLYSGVNWVAWNGRDEWPLDQVARGIGKSRVSIRVDGRTWPAPLDGSVDEFPALRRGDAVRDQIPDSHISRISDGLVP